MPIYRLDDRIAFPRPELADHNGLLAVGGDLRPERLLLAYSIGVFPWYSEGLPILWHSPDPRMVLAADDLHVPRSLRKTLRRGTYELRLDTAFREVMSACAETPRPNEDGTWITDEMLDAYCELHELGFAHSIEAWRGDELCGGLYGVSIGTAFFGESMFARAPDASKAAFVCLVEQLRAWEFAFVDCQVYTSHLDRFGAALWSRSRYLRELAVAVTRPTRRGAWQLEPSVIESAARARSAP